jgi:hypothetical protein
MDGTSKSRCGNRKRPVILVKGIAEQLGLAISGQKTNHDGIEPAVACSGRIPSHGSTTQTGPQHQQLPQHHQAFTISFDVLHVRLHQLGDAVQGAGAAVTTDKFANNRANGPDSVIPQRPLCHHVAVHLFQNSHKIMQ